MSEHNHSSIEVGPADEAEFDALVRIIGQALCNSPDFMRPWLAGIGMPNLRAVRKHGKVVAGLGIMPMGQWFGGRSVPIWGITAVGVAPEQRGTGVGITLLRRTLEEQHAAGVPLAALYPATVAFYRRNGYAPAATRTVYELPAAAITVADRTLDVVEVEPAEHATIRQVYTQRARISAGHLDRHEMLWQRLFDPIDKKETYKYLVVRDGVPEGYVVFAQKNRDDPFSMLDICALSRAAGLRLLTLLADHRSVIQSISWSGAPLDPLNYLLPEPRHKVNWSIDLMLRIVDVPGALAARGYPPGVRAELHLEVADEVLPWNNGRFVLEVADGRAQARTGGAGRVRLDVRDLASLYSGYLTPLELRTVGTLEAPDTDLAAAGLVFAGPRPWSPDMF